MPSPPLRKTIGQAATEAIPVRPIRHIHLTFPPYLLYLWKLNNHYRRRYQRTLLSSTYQVYLFLTQIFSTYFTRHRNFKLLLKLSPTANHTILENLTVFHKMPDIHSPLIHQGEQVYLSPHKTEVLAQ